MGTPRTTTLVIAIAVTAALLVVGNLFASMRDETTGESGWLTNWLLALAALGVAYLSRIRRTDVGLQPRNVGRSVLLGVIGGALLAAPAALSFVLAPLVLGDPVEYEDVDAGGGELALRLGAGFLLGTALPEELIFRGVLYGLWQQAAGERTAIVATSVAFAFWHIAVTFQSVDESGIADQPALFLGSYVGALVALGIAGAAFGLLRARTGSVIAPTAAHWVAVVVMRAALRVAA